MAIEEKDIAHGQISFRDYVIQKIKQLSEHPLDDDPHERLNELMNAADFEIDHQLVFLDAEDQRNLDPLISKIKWSENPNAATEAMQIVINYIKDK